MRGVSRPHLDGEGCGAGVGQEDAGGHTDATAAEHEFLRRVDLHKHAWWKVHKGEVKRRSIVKQWYSPFHSVCQLVNGDVAHAKC